MKRFILLFCVCVLTFHFSVEAQNATKKAYSDKFSAALGFGQDYGGVGFNLLYYPKRSIGCFAAGGFAFVSLGYNVGLKTRFFLNKENAKVNPFLMGMYGYNCVVIMPDEDFSKIFNGFSVGAGIDYHRNPAKRTYWSFAILMPFKTKEAVQYLDDMQNQQNVTFFSRNIPVTLSVGSHIIF